MREGPFPREARKVFNTQIQLNFNSLFIYSEGYNSSYVVSVAIDIYRRRPRIVAAKNSASKLNLAEARFRGNTGERMSRIDMQPVRIQPV